MDVDVPARLARPWSATLFGPVSVVGSLGQAARFETRKTAELFAYLATYPDRDHLREALAEILWPEGDPKALRHRLAQALSALRREFGEVEIVGGDTRTVRLHSEFLATDVQAFEASIATARAVSNGARTGALERAIDLYQAEFMAGCDADWVLEVRQRLNERRREALTLLKAEYEGQGDLPGAILCAQKLTEDDPLDEEIAFDLIRLLAQSGQTAQALRQYRTLERDLQTQLRETPSAATRTLMQKVRRQHDAQLAERAGPTGAKEGEPTREASSSFPRQYTRFFGRETEISTAVRALVEGEIPLLTLTGVAGCGKTRLAIEVAQRIREGGDFATWFVSLAEVRTPSEVPATILHALRPWRLEAVSVVEQIVGALAHERRALIVLDNFDHLAEESSDLSALMARLPQVRFLITSRQRLNVEAEMEMVVPPLPVDGDAVRLFVDRAQGSRPGFDVTPQNMVAVRALCARLEGIPLAIELAASWANVLNPEQMLSEVNRRFDLLVSRRRDIPKRHRTLRAAIEYSYQLLTPDLQQFFAQLSVFQGGWSLEAARLVCQEMEPLDRLGRLLDRSLIVAEDVPSPESGGVRYCMLDTLREFAWEKLTGDQRSELALRHADYFGGLAQQASAKMTGPEQAGWLTLVDWEHRNFVAALHWCHRHEQTDSGLRMASALGTFWEVRGPRTEGIHWLSAFLNSGSDDVPPLTTARGLATLGHLEWCQSHYDEAERAHRRCMEIQRQIEDIAGQARSLYHLGIISVRRGQHDAARQAMEESLVLAGQVGDRATMAKALLNLGNIAKYTGDPDAARAYYERSLELEQSLGNWDRVGVCLNNMGTLALSEGKHVVAEFYLTESLKTHDSVQNRAGAGVAQMNLGKNAERRGDLDLAQERLLAALDVHKEVGNAFFMRESYVELAKVRLGRGETEAAATLLAGADLITRQIGAPMPPEDARVYDEVSGRCREALDDQAWEAARATAQTARYEDLRRIAGSEKRGTGQRPV